MYWKGFYYRNAFGKNFIMEMRLREFHNYNELEKSLSITMYLESVLLKKCIIESFVIRRYWKVFYHRNAF